MSTVSQLHPGKRRKIRKITSMIIIIKLFCSQSPTFNGNVRFRFIDQSTRNFDLNTSPEFRNFILASHLRLRLIDYFTESTSLQHRYYSIQELAVAARCACNGHASRCDGGIDAVCQCVHNTEGRNCERCLPTHNDKGWRYGTSTNGFPCKPCRCNNHATTCIYNATVDPFPNSYELGGGGVCQDCQNNTGKQTQNFRKMQVS